MPNLTKILAARANYELATVYLSSWLQPTMDYATKLGYSVTDLYGEDATLANFMNALNVDDPALVLIGGHGAENLVTGQNGEVLLEACVNDGLMQQRTAVLAACATGVKLGPSMINKGANAYVGFQADFIFSVTPGYETRPLHDPRAAPFFTAINTLMYALLDGKTLSEIYEVGVASFNEEISKWWNNPDPEASDIISYLQWDRDNFIVIGNKALYETPTRRALLIPKEIPPIIMGGLALLILFGR